MLYFKFWLADWESSRIKRRASREAVGLFLGDILPRLYTSPDPGYYCEVDGDGVRYFTEAEMVDDLTERADDPEHVALLVSELVKYRGLVKGDRGLFNEKAVEVATECSAKSTQASLAAKKRWEEERRRKADAMQTHSGRNADASNQHMQSELESELQVELESELEPKDTDTPRVCAREEPKPRPPLGTNDAVLSVVEAWRLAWDSPDYRHGLNDTIAVNDALADGWTIEQLCESMAGWGQDPWSKRKYHNSIPKLLEHVQKGIDLGKKQTGPLTLADIGRGGTKP